MDHGHGLHLLGGSISHCLLLHVLLRCIAVGHHVRLLLLRIRLLLLLFLHGTYDYLLLLGSLVVIPPSIGLLLLHLLRLLLSPELAGLQLLLLRILLLLLWWLGLLLGLVVLLFHGSCCGLEVWAWGALTLVTNKRRHHLWLDLMLLLVLLVLNDDRRLLIAHIQVVLEHGLLEAKIATTHRSTLHILTICGIVCAIMQNLTHIAVITTRVKASTSVTRRVTTRNVWAKALKNQ